MRAQRIDGKALAAKIRAQVAARAQALTKRIGRSAGLAVILVGDDPASRIYVNNKSAACHEAGVRCNTFRLPADSTEAQVAQVIDACNADRNTDGILVQLPLPSGLNTARLLARISPHKDVDGFHAENAGNLMLGNPCICPCTPQGCIELIRSTGRPIAGAHAVVVGRSNIVGKPMAMLLLANDATVTIAHSKTENLGEITRSAQILVSAVGKANFITADMVRPGAVVIDVGMNRADGKLCGDADFEGVASVADFITPVPGGVGPMTIAELLRNTVTAAERHG